MPSICTMDAEPDPLAQIQKLVAELSSKPVPSSKSSEDNAKWARKAQEAAQALAAKKQEALRIAQIAAQRSRQQLAEAAQLAEPKMAIAQQEAEAAHQSMVDASAAASADTDIHTSKPSALWQAVQPCPEPPPAQVAALQPVRDLVAATQRVAPAAAPPTPEAAFSHLLHQPGALARCTDPATVQAVFHTACCSQDPDLAAAACSTFLELCGLPAAMAAGDLVVAPCTLPYAGCTPGAPLCWVPGAEDFLAALRVIGCSASGGGPGAAASAAAAAAGGGRQQQQQQQQGGSGEAYRDGPLRHALTLLTATCQLAAAGRLSVPLQEGACGELAVLLLRLQADPRVQVRALAAAQEALDALAGALDDAAWARVGGEVAAALGALDDPTGPSHRAAVWLLQQLPSGPRHPRLTALKQAGSMQLLRALLKHPHAGKGGPHGPSLGVPLQDLLALLKDPRKGSGAPAAAAAGGRGGGGSGRREPANQLLDLLRGAAGAAQQQHVDMWALLSVLDAADVFMWTYMEPDALQQHAAAHAWWLQYLNQVERVVFKHHRLQSQYIKTRTSELYNVYAALCTGAVDDYVDEQEGEEEP